MQRLVKYYKEHKREMEDKYVGDENVCFDKIEDISGAKWSVKDEIENQKLLKAIDESNNDGVVILVEEQKFVSIEGKKWFLYRNLKKCIK